MFILATTDADKLPATILSRVQQFFFRPIPTEIMTRQLMNIAKKEGFAIEEDAARLIAERSRGGFRDGISMLDQLSILATSDQPLTANMVTEYLGLSDATMLGNLLDSYPSDDNEKVLNIFQELENSGANSVIVSHQLLSIARNRLRKNPNLIGLVQQLIEVDRHPHPDLKLLTIFMNSNSQPTEKPVAPKKNIAQAATQKPAKKPTPIKSAEPTKPTEKPIEKEEKPAEPAKKTAAKPKKTDAPLELNWEKVIERAKEKSLGLASLLQKSQWSFDGKKLTIYAGSAFYKKKLDDAKNKPLISEIISEETTMDLEIDIIGEKKPPEDKKLAEIAELMGGGEEVKLDDI